MEGRRLVIFRYREEERPSFLKKRSKKLLFAVADSTAEHSTKTILSQTGSNDLMDALTLFGLFAVSAMLVCYALESRSHWFVFLFALSCALGSIYGFLQGAWPFGGVEAVWSLVALRRWGLARR